MSLEAASANSPEEIVASSMAVVRSISTAAARGYPENDVEMGNCGAGSGDHSASARECKIRVRSYNSNKLTGKLFGLSREHPQSLLNGLRHRTCIDDDRDDRFVVLVECEGGEIRQRGRRRRSCGRRFRCRHGHGDGSRLEHEGTVYTPVGDPTRQNGIEQRVLGERDLRVARTVN